MDDEHLRALGRVVVAATWMETVLDHVVRGLVDDGPVYLEMVAGQSVSQLCDLTPRLARHVVKGEEAQKVLRSWLAEVQAVAKERNGLLHAGHFQSEDDPRERLLVIGKRAKRSLPPIEISASVNDVLGLAGRIDAVSSRGLDLMGTLAAAYRGRTPQDDPPDGCAPAQEDASTVETPTEAGSHGQ